MVVTTGVGWGGGIGVERVTGARGAKGDEGDIVCCICGVLIVGIKQVGKADSSAEGGFNKRVEPGVRGAGWRHSLPLP